MQNHVTTGGIAFGPCEIHMAGGYEAPFVVELSASHTCPICHLGLKEPQLTICGHQFCGGCLRPLIKDNKLACPVCRTELKSSDLFPNNAIKRDVLNLKIKCDLYREGCEWVAELAQKEAHFEQCGFVTVPCPQQCGMPVRRKDLEKHKTSQCKFRDVTCPHCHEVMKFRDLKSHIEHTCLDIREPCSQKCGQIVVRRDIAIHNESCPCAYVVCPNQCDEDVQRKYLKRHLRYLCERRTVTCNYCHEHMEKRQLQDHRSSCPKYPIACIYQCRRQVARCEMNDHVGRHGNCPSSQLECDFCSSGCKFTGKRRELEEHLSRDNLEHLILVMNLVHTQNTHLRRVECQLRSTKATLRQRESELDHIKAEVASKLPQLNLPHPGEFVHLWKIDHWSDRMQEAVLGTVTRITSGPMYTDHPGHRVSFDVCPNGSMLQLGSHVSVFPIVESGEYDEELVWPVHVSFRVTVIDQQSNGEHKWAVFETECRSGAAYWGQITDLISHNHLAERCFIKNDSILLKFSVKVSN